MKKPFGPFSRLCRLPADLESVTVRGEEADPRDSGISPEAIERLWQGVQSLYRSGLHPAPQICIRREGCVVLHRAIGYARGNDPDDPPSTAKTPVQLDTPFVLYSASKGVTAFLILKLDELPLCCQTSTNRYHEGSLGHHSEAAIDARRYATGARTSGVVAFSGWSRGSRSITRLRG